MQSLYYSVIGTLAIVVHLILNPRIFYNPNIKKSHAEKYFHIYLITVLVYYITDTFWGLISHFGKTKLLYADTFFYYIAMAFSVVFCCLYIIEFLKLNRHLANIIKIFGLTFCVVELSVLIINLFIPIFFYFDSEGNYHAGIFRYAALIVQVFMFASITLISFFVALKKSSRSKKRNSTICIFGLVMTGTIIGQSFFPLLPLYSIGLMLGTCVLHVFVQEDIKDEQYETLASLASIFYSLHVLDLIHDTVNEFNAVNEVKELVNHNQGAKEMMEKTISTVITPEFKEAALKFTDLNTIAERMKNKNYLADEFVGKRVGWFLASFIVMEQDNEGKPTKVIFSTRIIDEEKKQKEKLIQKSQTDEMTGLLNRRAYEEDIYYPTNVPEEENFIYISIDVNSLKIINDTLGHLAGDELIIGACQCMKDTLASYGKIYRIGGDEFVAILFCNEEKIQNILSDFDNACLNWQGNLIDNISVSYGWISKNESPKATVRELGIIAEKRMYEAKRKYYASKGVDRRGQAAAHTALCNLYTKILKINLTNDSYSIVNMDVSEQTSEKGFSTSISQWLTEFGKSGQVHKDDLENYLQKTDLNYLKNYFSEGKTSISIFYRRKYQNDFKQVAMEMIPADDYSSENQTLFLYVKNIDH